MKRKIMFIVELEADVADGMTHTQLGELLRPNVRQSVWDINRHWARQILACEVVYLPQLLPPRT